MIYLDTSVALAQLLAEDRCPAADLWDEDLISSRLLHYELWNRINARHLERSHSQAVHELLARVAVVEMFPDVLHRALQPFPVPVRTLDALHLATVDFCQARGQTLTLATYDDRLLRAANRMGFETVVP